MEVHVVEVPWSTHSDRLKSIRRSVFVEEQQVPEQLEWDGQDDGAVHLLAINEAGQAIGTARLLPTSQIGRMAVLSELRNHGIGRRLLDLAVQTASDRGMESVFLHAQGQAVDFYRQAGFSVEGDEFLEAGIPHVRMTLKLPLKFAVDEFLPSDARAEPSRETFQQSPQPERDNWLFEDTAASVAVLGRVISFGVRKLQIVSQDLDDQLFGHPMVVDSISGFARAHPAARVQILVFSTSLIVSRGHRLVELARRLPSKLNIRKVASDYTSERRSWVAADDRSIWVLPNHEEHTGVAGTYEPVEAKRLGEAFDYLWERSQPDSELRALKL